MNQQTQEVAAKKTVMFPVVQTAQTLKTLKGEYVDFRQLASLMITGRKPTEQEAHAASSTLAYLFGRGVVRRKVLVRSGVPGISYTYTYKRSIPKRGSPAAKKANGKGHHAHKNRKPYTLTPEGRAAIITGQMRKANKVPIVQEVDDAPVFAGSKPQPAQHRKLRTVTFTGTETVIETPYATLYIVPKGL